MSDLIGLSASFAAPGHPAARSAQRASGARSAGGAGGARGGTHRDEAVATREKAKIERPPRFKVVLYNDDYTPMEFVVMLLEQVFKRPPVEATQLMLQIHRGGKGIAGVYVLEVAETKVSAVHKLAEERGYPLQAGVEPE